MRALDAEIGPLKHALAEVGGGPALFIGSGGSMAIAELAAYVHERHRRQPARACTSLEALDAPQLARRGAVLFSSSAKHPDAQRVLETFRRRQFSPAVLVTHREAQDIQSAAGGDSVIVSLPRLEQPDGFLATGSILQLAVMLLRAQTREQGLPPSLLNTAYDDEPLREEVLVLTSPSLRSVATDLEVRLVESGLAAVQVADYRNFAHGRHTGFARRQGRVTVIALSDSESEALAAGTTDALPAGSDVRRWHADGPWEAAVLELLHRSISLAGDVGERVGLDVARPQVPVFGRRLYRLPLSKRIPRRPVGGIERKVLASGLAASDDAWDLYANAASEWSERIRGERFTGLVLDYDGTVCWTNRRYELPEVEVREQLVRILDSGALLGFASGRGRSLYEDLRKWVPEAQWERVVVGIYNGGIVLSLADELPDLREPTAWSRAVRDVVGTIPASYGLDVTERGAQVSVSALGSGDPTILAALISDHMASTGMLATVAASGHSIDIVPTTSSKLAVVTRVETESGGPVLAIGDQGQLGGNDHTLLARGPFTLSVDRCSSNPESCWFVGTGEHVGPALVERHLRSMRSRRSGLELTGIGVK